MNSIFDIKKFRKIIHWQLLNVLHFFLSKQNASVRISQSRSFSNCEHFSKTHLCDKNQSEAIFWKQKSHRIKNQIQIESNTHISKISWIKCGQMYVFTTPNDYYYYYLNGKKARNSIVSFRIDRFQYG